MRGSRTGGRSGGAAVLVAVTGSTTTLAVLDVG
ncbi:hypothetical protein EV186_105393 [Labedaea rhizosphaerae]|uniref:Uncharacterized protein n=1 Tax=Labedaea rhizosphaerae TaxID=598644 RepID=A0A4R6S656_LABRH|nr:hypothetical protein EV186_105393 [Labedaea rhizosphaerae]